MPSSVGDGLPQKHEQRLLLLRQPHAHDGRALALAAQHLERLAFQVLVEKARADVGLAAHRGGVAELLGGGVDGVASVGYGLSLNLIGLEVHWDFARRTDLKHTMGGTRTEFWVGETF